MTRLLPAAVALVALAGCSADPKPAATPPTAVPTSASPTVEPPRSYPPEWEGDPDGKAACDTVRALYEAGPVADRPNPGVDALAVAATRGMKSRLARIAGASVDLNVEVQRVRGGAGRGAEISMISAAYTLGRICFEERYYKPEPWPPVSSGP